MSSGMPDVSEDHPPFVILSFCRRERKIYFEKLDVAVIRCNLTLIPRPGQRGEADPVCQAHETDGVSACHLQR